MKAKKKAADAANDEARIKSEEAAIAKRKKDLEDAKIYVDLFPCNECAKIIIQSGIKEVIYLCDKYANSENNIASRKLFDECGVQYNKIKLKQERDINIELK